jgi:DNA-binding LacI/PurR family transcriptional regulator
MTPPKPRNPTSFDVAELAGVSRSAVSRAFTEGATVAPETRAKVLDAANALGYVVNPLARGLQKGSSNIVGLVASRLDTPIRGRQIKLLAQGLLGLGFRPMLITAEDEGDLPGLLRSALSYNVAGMIVTSDTPPPELVQECADRSIPLVLVNRDPMGPAADRVQIDPVAGGRTVFDLLLECGARGLACLTPAGETFSVTGRADSFVAAGTAKGLPCRVVVAENQSYAAGRRAIADLGIGGLAGVDGLFCATDLMALGALDALRIDLGLRVPDQVQVVGFDDIEQAGWGAYQLTTVRQDLEEQSRMVLQLLTARIGDRSRPPQLCVQSLSCVPRATTRKPLAR